jgi:hypothetical protein
VWRIDRIALSAAQSEFDLAMPDTGIDFGFVAPPRLDAFDALVTLWQRARAVAESTPACPCHGIVAGIVDPDVMETNMLELLRARYRDNDEPELLAIVERRLRKSPFAGMRQPFPHWLRHLREVALGAAARQALCDDLAVALRAYADAGPVFTCV